MDTKNRAIAIIGPAEHGFSVSMIQLLEKHPKIVVLPVEDRKKKISELIEAIPDKTSVILVDSFSEMPSIEIKARSIDFDCIKVEIAKAKRIDNRPSREQKNYGSRKQMRL